MKQTITFLSTMLLLSTLIQNCSCKHRCMAPAPTARLVGFDSTELQTVIVKKYVNNGKFTDIMYSSVYTSTHKAFYGSDTFELTGDNIIVEAFDDYMVTVPAAARAFALKNVQQQPAYLAEKYCTSGLKYTLNDTNYQLPADATMNYAPMVIELKR